MVRAAGGEALDDILPTLPVAPNAMAAGEHFQQALALFEKLGDRRGVMSTIIAMAYLDFGADIHIGSNPAQRIEEIRRLSTRMRSLAKESERAAADAQMAYGVHVFARAKVIPDLAISRGEEAYWAAKTLGDRSLEFLSAGGTGAWRTSISGEVAEAGTVARSGGPGRGRRADAAAGSPAGAVAGHGPSRGRATSPACASTSIGR